MTNVSPSARSPVLGVGPLSDIYNATDSGFNQISPGTIVRAMNGKNYMFVQASAGIADDTAAIVTVGGTPAAPTFTAAGGAGAWTTRSGAVTTGQRFWIEANAI